MNNQHPAELAKTVERKNDSNSPCEDRIERNRRVKTWILRSLLMIAILLIVSFAYAQLSQKPPLMAVQKVVNIPSVDILELQPQDYVIPIKSYGSAEASLELTLTATVEGEVEYSFEDLKPGTIIHKGTLLLKIDTEVLEQRKVQQEAAIQRIISQLSNLETERQNLLHRMQILNEQQQLVQQKMDRYTGLSEGAIPKTQLDDLQLQELQYRDQVVMLRSQVANLPHRKEQLEADLKGKRADLELINLDLQQATIYAPFDAIIRQGDLSVGSYVNARTPIITLEKIGSVEIHFALPLSDYRRAFSSRDELLGKPVRVHIPSDTSGDYWEARMIIDEAQVQDRTRSVPLIAKVEDIWSQSGIRLLPGTFTELEFEGKTLEDVFVIPLSALQEEQFVYILTRDNTLAIRTVEVIDQIAGEQDVAIIKQGLQAGEYLVVSKLTKPVEGMDLKPSDN